VHGDTRREEVLEAKELRDCTEQAVETVARDAAPNSEADGGTSMLRYFED